jgi:hypothetical protein
MAATPACNEESHVVDTEDRPVLTGLIALVAVAAVIGIIGGLAALVGSKVLGLDGDTTASPVDPSDANSKEIELSAGQQSVSAMQQIDLTGSYPTGEGAILQVQRLEDGSWEDFPVTASVNNQTFSTYVQTGQTGENTFRVIDTDKDLVSNEVVVTVG